MRAEIAIAFPVFDRSPVVNAFSELAVKVISAGPAGVVRWKSDP